MKWSHDVVSSREVELVVAVASAAVVEAQDRLGSIRLQLVASRQVPAK